MSDWNFFSNHGHVLLALAEYPDARLRDLADRVGITERAVHRILADLERAGMITRERLGRRNHYSIQKGEQLRHPIESHRSIGELIDLIWGDSARPRSGEGVAGGDSDNERDNGHDNGHHRHDPMNPTARTP